jgi:hypothetical protein
MYVDPKATKKQLHPEFSHAMIFLFDCSEIATFNIVTDYMEAFDKIEESKRSNINSKKENNTYQVKKVMIIKLDVL